MGNDISRRQLLRNSLVLGGVAATPLFGAVCKLTPPDQEGPYYPEGDLERDADLVSMGDKDPEAKGQIVFITGQVTDPECKPLAGALVEIWQACFSGKYNHSEDPNNLELDRNFQYWGRAHTDAQGNYKFRTVVPGHYPAGKLPNGETRYRPPHIHYKVHAKGHQTLTTQMYFDPKSYDDKELVEFVKKWNAFERVPAALTVHFKPEAFLPDAGAKLGKFDITLRKV